MRKIRPATLGDLKKSGWKSRSVKDELRDNLRARIQAGENVFEGIIGYDKTVIPNIENALLARHNFILLGLRGQAKSRIIRQLYMLLDEFVPIIPGSMLNEDPINPLSPKGKRMVEELGDKMPIDWIHRSDRYHEKLATPDVSIADLIGDVDPIKAAREKLDISNEEVIHWGIIPRTNRGIFAINELPDLQPRIQVGLLNILEEKDIQVRGFPLRVPLDMLLVFTANPEDYTNRGNIITPLKDRIDSQIITHYPRTLADARAITENEADVAGDIHVPDIVRDIIEEISFQARESEYVDQTSGVSARVSISAYEALLSNIERRVLRNRDNDCFPRMADIYAAIPAVTGKIELVYEGEQEGPTLVAHNLIGLAIKEVFTRHFPEPRSSEKRHAERTSREQPYEAVTDFFSAGRKLELSDEMTYDQYKKALSAITGLDKIVKTHFETKDEREFLLRMELVLEGLHQYNVIARETRDTAVSYGDVFSDMLRSMGDNR